ncbi:MAG: alpha/beta hydrolase-fold protein [Gemmatimonadota bacterium]|nr:alpha/beta hydrolase-fold protein [Gemmatimonadota bacterium]
MGKADGATPASGDRFTIGVGSVPSHTASSDPRIVQVKEHTARPTVSVLRDAFAIPQLGGRTRRIWIYLPTGYATGSRRYPVLYMHDGQNVFDNATSFAGEWGVDESLDSLAALGDRGIIVVAVDHGGSKRLDEYSPWKNLRQDARVYIVSGALEAATREKAAVYVKDQERMLEALIAAGLRRDSSVAAYVRADGKHSEWFWRREFPTAYRWPFRP